MAYDVGQGQFQIVPSFKGVAEAITEEARKWGVSAGDAFGDAFSEQVRIATADLLGSDDLDAAEKGDSAGSSFADAFRARVDAALRSLPDADVGLDATEAEQGIADIRAELLSLRAQRIGIDISDTDALAKLTELKLALADIGHTSESITVKVNAAQAITEITALETSVAGASDLLDGFGGGGGGDPLEKAEEDAAGAGISISSILVPALVAAGLALIPIAGLAGGALATLPSILGGLGVGFAAIAIAAPAIKSAVTGIFDPLVKQLTPFVEGAILPGLTAGLQAVVPLFQAVAPFIVDAALGMGELADNVGHFLGSATGIGETNTILQAGVGFLQQMGNNAETLLQAFFSVGSQASPIVSALGSGITNIVNALARWAEGGGFQTFLNWLKQNGPGIVSDLSAFAKGVGPLVVALTPVGLLLLGLLKPLGDLLGFLSRSPAALAAVSLALGGFGIALALALDTNPIVLIITAIGLLIIGITELVTHWDAVWGEIKQVFDDAVNFLRSGFAPLILLILGPIGALLLLAANWQTIWGTITSVAGAAWDWLQTNVFSPIAYFFSILLPGAINAVGGFFSTMVSDIGKVLSTLASIIEAPFQEAWKVIGPIVSGIESAVNFITGSGGSVTPNSGASNHGGSVGKASGGPVSPFGTYLVGERGPEILQMGASGGNVLPNSTLSALGTVNLTGAGGPLQHVDQQNLYSAVDVQAVGQQLAFLSRGRRL